MLWALKGDFSKNRRKSFRRVLLCLLMVLTLLPISIPAKLIKADDGYYYRVYITDCEPPSGDILHKNISFVPARGEKRFNASKVLSFTAVAAPLPPECWSTKKIKEVFFNFSVSVSAIGPKKYLQKDVLEVFGKWIINLKVKAVIYHSGKLVFESSWYNVIQNGAFHLRVNLTRPERNYPLASGSTYSYVYSCTLAINYTFERVWDTGTAGSRGNLTLLVKGEIALENVAVKNLVDDEISSITISFQINKGFVGYALGSRHGFYRVYVYGIKGKNQIKQRFHLRFSPSWGSGWWINTTTPYWFTFSANNSECAYIYITFPKYNVTFGGDLVETGALTVNGSYLNVQDGISKDVISGLKGIACYAYRAKACLADLVYEYSLELTPRGEVGYVLNGTFYKVKEVSGYISGKFVAPPGAFFAVKSREQVWAIIYSVKVYERHVFSHIVIEKISSEKYEQLITTSNEIRVKVDGEGGKEVYIKVYAYYVEPQCVLNITAIWGEKNRELSVNFTLNGVPRVTPRILKMDDRRHIIEFPIKAYSLEKIFEKKITKATKLKLSVTRRVYLYAKADGFTIIYIDTGLKQAVINQWETLQDYFDTNGSLVIRVIKLGFLNPNALIRVFNTTELYLDYVLVNGQKYITNQVEFTTSKKDKVSIVAVYSSRQSDTVEIVAFPYTVIPVYCNAGTHKVQAQGEVYAYVLDDQHNKPLLLPLRRVHTLKAVKDCFISPHVNHIKHKHISDYLSDACLGDLPLLWFVVGTRSSTLCIDQQTYNITVVKPKPHILVYYDCEKESATITLTFEVDKEPLDPLLIVDLWFEGFTYLIKSREVDYREKIVVSCPFNLLEDAAGKRELWLCVKRGLPILTTKIPVKTINHTIRIEVDNEVLKIVVEVHDPAVIVFKAENNYEIREVGGKWIIELNWTQPCTWHLWIVQPVSENEITVPVHYYFETLKAENSD